MPEVQWLTFYQWLLARERDARDRGHTAECREFQAPTRRIYGSIILALLLTLAGTAMSLPVLAITGHSGVDRLVPAFVQVGGLAGVALTIMVAALNKVVCICPRPEGDRARSS